MKNTKHRQRLNAAYNEYQRLIRGLPENVLKLRLTSLANKSDNEVDPFVRALARRELESMGAKGAVSQAQKELAELRNIPEDMHFPGQPNRRAEQALRKDELSRTINHEMGRQLLLAQDPMMAARKEAIAAYEAQEATEARQRAIAERVALKKAAIKEAELDAAAERAVAAERAKGK